MGIGNKQQNEEVSLLHPEHLSSVTKLTLLAMASIALSGYYRALDYGAWPEGEVGCFLIQVAIFFLKFSQCSSILFLSSMTIFMMSV